MRQAQEVQKKIQQAQENLSSLEFEGSAGGGMVRVVVNGAGIAKKINIEPSLLVQDEKDILEDLIIAAFNDAKKKSDEGSNEKMKLATSGIALPPGFKL